MKSYFLSTGLPALKAIVSMRCVTSARTVTTSSPLGTALIGASKDQQIEVDAPGGSFRYVVVGFEPFVGDAGIDQVFRYSAGARYRLRPQTTIGLDSDYVRFHGNEIQRNYDRLRIVSSLAVHF